MVQDGGRRVRGRRSPSFRRMIIIDIEFQERRVEIMQDNHTQINTGISTYHHTEDQAMVIAKIQGFDW